MSENGKSHKSIPGQIVALLEDQIDLASLEWRYEKRQSLRRIVALVASGVFALAAFIFVQVAIVAGIAAKGMSIWLSSLVLAGLYCLIAVFLMWKFGRRDPKTGRPFHGTRTELKRNLKWIEQLFS